MKSDSKLQHDVLGELDWEPSVEASQIGITAKEGVVALTGHVSSHTEKYTAEQVAKRVHGVKAVANDIEVRLSEHHQRDDEEIATAALHSLEWGGKVPDDRIQVIVRDGWITLEGAVDHRFERDAAERSVRHLKGVRGLTNDILVEPAKPAAVEEEGVHLLKEAIDQALRRSAIVNSAQVSVEVDQGIVVLTGEVRSRAEFDEAERVAWNARNIAGVENCLSITPWGFGPKEEWGY